jgi:hypothetical protein
MDSVAGKMFAKLQEMGVGHLKRKFWPGTSKTIYHNAWMTIKVAEWLFTASITEVDEYDQDGMTPLLLNAHVPRFTPSKDSFLVLIWFFDRGAKNLICPKLNGYTLVHKLAANLGRNWERHDSIYNPHKTFGQLLARVLEKSAELLPAQPTGLCQCFCSLEGCLPIQSLVNHMPYTVI